MSRKIVELGEISNVTKLAGYEFTKHITYNNDGEIIALRALNLSVGQLDLTNIKRIGRSVSEELPRSKLHKGDVLLSYTGTVGNYAIIEKDDVFHLAPNVCRIRASEKCIPEYLYYVVAQFVVVEEGGCFVDEV